MKRAAVLLILLAVFASCRTARPKGAPLEPLTSTTLEEAQAQLRSHRENFLGLRSLMRVRATVNGSTQSFRAQVYVQDDQRMELVAYTPVGTPALTLKANGQNVTTDPAVPPESFAFLQTGDLTPAETAMLLLGLPPRSYTPVVITATGLESAVAGSWRVTFDPPSFPAKNVVVTRGADRIEIEHLEVVR